VIKVYQLLAHGRWFSPASSTTKTGRHDIAESGIKHNKSINQTYLQLSCDCEFDSSWFHSVQPILIKHVGYS
jgi:hypothetical protein